MGCAYRRFENVALALGESNVSEKTPTFVTGVGVMAAEDSSFDEFRMKRYRQRRFVRFFASQHYNPSAFRKVPKAESKKRLAC